LLGQGIPKACTVTVKSSPSLGLALLAESESSARARLGSAAPAMTAADRTHTHASRLVPGTFILRLPLLGPLPPESSLLSSERDHTLACGGHAEQVVRQNTRLEAVQELAVPSWVAAPMVPGRQRCLNSAPVCERGVSRIGEMARASTHWTPRSGRRGSQRQWRCLAGPMRPSATPVRAGRTSEGA